MRMISIMFLAFSLAFSLARPGVADIQPGAAQHVLDATLMLRSADGRDRFLGSGFAYGASTRAVTNAHVVGKADVVTVVTRDGVRMDARVIAIDRTRDLAVLALAQPVTTVLQPAAQELQPGRGVYAAGAPLEAAFTLTAGVVSALDRQIDPTQPVGYVQHSAPVNPGSSGGPLVDVDGRVLGVNTRIADGSRFFVGIAYAVPVAVLDRFVAAGTLPNRPAPGLKLRPLTPQIRAALDHEGPGVLVEQVHPDTPADAAGLRAGDILTHVDGTAMGAPGDLAFALGQSADRLRVRIKRAEQSLTLTISFVASPSLLAPQTAQAVPRKSRYKLTDMGMILDRDGQIRAVVNDGAGFFAGLSGGDRIMAINGVPVEDLAADWPASYAFDAPILLRIQLPDGATRHYLLDPWDPGTGLRLASRANVLDVEVISFD